MQEIKALIEGKAYGNKTSPEYIQMKLEEEGYENPTLL
jgi:hypothetical protein